MGNLLSVWGTVGSVLLAILILLVMITIHELGHYLVGKLLKFKIDEFAVGFGPALFKRKRKKSGEIFSVRLIPLGGFCAFAGEDGLEEEHPASASEEGKGEHSEGQTADMGATEELTAGSDVILVTPAEPASKVQPAEGVPAEVPPPETAPAEASPPQDKKKKRARLTYEEDGLFTRMKPWKRILVLVAGACMNYLLALVFLIALFFGYGQSFLEVGSAKTSDEYPAAYSFQAGDILLAAEGRDLYLTTDLIGVVDGKKDQDEVTFRVLRLREDGTREETEQVIRLRAVDREGNKLEKIEVANSSDYSTVYRALGMGTEWREDGNEYYTVSGATWRFGFFETIGRAIVYSFRLAGSIFRILGELLTGVLGIKAVGGPVTTVVTASEVVSTGGLRGFLEIAGFIGVNLAVMNLLPIPALDGSKVVFTLIEWVRGRPIPRKAEAIIHTVGLVLLFAFAILVDILQFV